MYFYVIGFYFEMDPALPIGFLEVQVNFAIWIAADLM